MPDKCGPDRALPGGNAFRRNSHPERDGMHCDWGRTVTAAAGPSAAATCAASGGAMPARGVRRRPLGAYCSAACLSFVIPNGVRNLGAGRLALGGAPAAGLPPGAETLAPGNIPARRSFACGSG